MSMRLFLATVVFNLVLIQNIFAAENILKGYNLAGWKTDFGIEDRLRYEYRSDFDFNKSSKDNGSLIFNRVRINGKFNLNDKYELFIEGLDGRVGSYRIKKTAQTTDFDLHQAYLKINKIINSGFAVKLGRQELTYGKGRLIAAPTWSNRINSFDAAVLRYNAGSFYGDLFIGYNVKYDVNNANHINDEEMLSGIYLGNQKDKKSPLLEGYFLSLIDNNKKSTGHIHRYTVGLRSQANFLGNYTYDFEMPFQFGKDGAKDIRAYALHLDVSRTFDIFLKPKLMFEFNLASGDREPNDSKSNTFIPLFQSTHGPYGIIDFFRWENMKEGAVSVCLSPNVKFQITPELHFYWLDSIHDSWYNSSGTKLRTGTKGNESSYVGSEASIWARYDLSKNIQLESGYSHFFTGSFVKDTGSNDDADWLYLQTTLKF